MVGYETALVFQKISLSVNSNENAGKRVVRRTSVAMTTISNGKPEGYRKVDVLTHLELGKFESSDNNS